MTVTLTGRPFPTNDHKSYFIFYLHLSAGCTSPPVQYIKNRAAKTFKCVVSCGTWFDGIVAKKKETDVLQLIAECMFCNFITKALFYAKYFDIFVTISVELLV